MHVERQLSGWEGLRAPFAAGGSTMSPLWRRVRRYALLVLAAGAGAGLIAGAAGGGEATPARAAANVTITAGDFFWNPDSVTINVGDTVTWTNAQGFHNVLLGDSRLNQPGFPTDPAWNPPPQMTFNEEGSYTFVCEVHPGMTGTVNVGDGGGEPTPTPTATPTPTPGVPPPGGGPPDSTAPAVSNLSVAGAPGRASVRLTVSEPATVNARFASNADVVRMRSQVGQGTWTLERPMPNGRYDWELWAVDAAGNRSSTEFGQVRIGG
jgi:plastocyanin